MITAIEARPGQGKTLYCVHLIEKYLNSGYRVVTNVKTSLVGAVYVASWEEILKIIYSHCSEDKMSKGREGSLKIVLDELNIYLNSRNWEKLPIEVQLVLAQHRHYGVDIIGCTQSVKRVDTIFRELVQVLYTLRKLVVFTVFGHTFGFFLLNNFDPDDIEVDRRERVREGWPIPIYIDPPVFKAFSSWQRLENLLLAEREEVVRYRTCSLGHSHKL